MYELLEVYAIEQEDADEPVGFMVREVDSNRVDSIHIYADSKEAQREVDQRNQRLLLSKHWPSMGDPDVIALLEDESFEAPEGRMRATHAMEVVARERAGIPG